MKIELFVREGNSRWGTDKPLGVFAIVDDEDYERVVKLTPVWRLHSAGYACTNKRVGNKTVVVLMHRFILGLSDKNLHTDHLDHNRLNNSKSNLVVCSQAENNRNLPYRGYGRHRDKWRAWSRCDSKHLGVFDTEQEAMEAVRCQGL